MDPCVHKCHRCVTFASSVSFSSLFQVDIDFEKEPIGTGKDGKSVYFRDIWPSNEEIAEVNYRYWQRK